MTEAAKHPDESRPKRCAIYARSATGYQQERSSVSNEIRALEEASRILENKINNLIETLVEVGCRDLLHARLLTLDHDKRCIDSQLAAAMGVKSDDLAAGHPIGIQRQIGACRAAATQMGFEVVDAHIYTDLGASGRATGGREGIISLLNAAYSVPRPFDCALVEDTTRFARNLGAMRQLLREFHTAGVTVYFVSSRTDSRDLLPALRDPGDLHNLEAI